MLLWRFRLLLLSRFRLLLLLWGFLWLLWLGCSHQSPKHPSKSRLLLRLRSFLLGRFSSHSAQETSAKTHGSSEDVLGGILSGLGGLLGGLNLCLVHCGLDWSGRNGLWDDLFSLQFILRNLREVWLGVTLSLVELLVPLALLETVVVLVVPEPVLALIPVVVVIFGSRETSQLLLDLGDLQIQK